MRAGKVATERDIIKSIALIAVIWQGVLNFVVKGYINIGQKTEILMLFNLVKFSAPVFIFAIAYDLSRIENGNYKEHISHKFKELIIPYLIWTTVYILTMNSLNSSSQYIEAIILGTAAPHLWYTVMMFQFQLLIVLFWKGYSKLRNDKDLIFKVLIITIVLYMTWLLIYNKSILNIKDNWLMYLDRSFISYSIYAVIGLVAATIEVKLVEFLSKFKFVILSILIVSFGYINYSILHNSDVMKITLHDIIYLKPEMLIYNIAIIMSLYLMAKILINKNSKMLKLFKFISTYAFRVYLANAFFLFIITKVFSSNINNLEFNIRLITLFILTTITSFGFVYGLDKVMSKINTIYNKKDRGEVNEAGIL